MIRERRKKNQKNKYEQLIQHIRCDQFSFSIRLNMKSNLLEANLLGKHELEILKEKKKTILSCSQFFNTIESKLIYIYMLTTDQKLRFK